MKIHKNIILPLLTFIPLVLIAVMIFGFSAQTGEQSDAASGGIVDWIISHIDTSSMNARQFEDLEYFVIHTVRKSAHFIEYAAFGFFLNLHLMTFIKKRSWLLAAFGGFVYAVGDEIHQLMVSERSGQISDVLIDTAGAVCGMLALQILLCMIRKIKLSKTKSRR